MNLVELLGSHKMAKDQKLEKEADMILKVIRVVLKNTLKDLIIKKPRKTRETKYESNEESKAEQTQDPEATPIL